MVGRTFLSLVLALTLISLEIQGFPTEERKQSDSKTRMLDDDIPTKRNGEVAQQRLRSFFAWDTGDIGHAEKRDHEVSQWLDRDFGWKRSVDTLNPELKVKRGQKHLDDDVLDRRHVAPAEGGGAWGNDLKRGQKHLDDDDLDRKSLDLEARRASERRTYTNRFLQTIDDPWAGVKEGMPQQRAVRGEGHQGSGQGGQLQL